MSDIPPLSFPYPESGGEVRPSGQGCLSCVHKQYCPAYYWQRRRGAVIDSRFHGISCASWSDREEDVIKTKQYGDLYQVAKWDIDGIAESAVRSTR